MASPSLDLYLALTPFREVIPEMHVLLRPLASVESILIGIDGYASSSVDAALIDLRFDRLRVEQVGLDRVVRLVSGLGLPSFAPESMTALDRETFYLQHLPSYDVYVQIYAETGEAGMVHRLVAALGEHVGDAATRRVPSPPTYLAS